MDTAVARVAAAFTCTSCGARSPGPLGRCPRCGAWGTVEEEAPSVGVGRSAGGRAVARPSSVRLRDVSDLGVARAPSGVGEVDRVLGGGWVAGGAVLLAGEPGIGKSTLLLQLADASARVGRRAVVVCGEESPGQVKLRAQRLGVSPEVELLRSTDAHEIAAFLADEAPALVIVDSIQTLTVDDGAAPGSLTQVRDATALLTQAAKSSGTVLVLIGHVTKQGAIAGPKVVEHVVDVTLALESAAGFRVLRGIKNRFGPAGEVGVFEMTDAGMRPVANPSDAFLAERPVGVPGSVVVAALEGQRPLLVEVQALASASPFATPRRVVQGLDPRRVDLVLAVLERRLELPLAGLDVFVNVAGGLRLTDPGADLAVAAAVASAVTNRPVAADTAVFGEVGLAGELRSVAQGARRAAEAARAGHPDVVGPRGGGDAVAWRAARDVAGAFAALWGRP
jgi:DNA repair protein RadA/Sms